MNKKQAAKIVSEREARRHKELPPYASMLDWRDFEKDEEGSRKAISMYQRPPSERGAKADPNTAPPVDEDTFFVTRPHNGSTAGDSPAVIHRLSGHPGKALVRRREHQLEPGEARTGQTSIQPFMFTKGEEQHAIDSAWTEYEDDDEWNGLPT